MLHPPPTFSVIIPTRDRPGELAACLESLARQHYPRDRFEVVVDDDASRLPLPAPVAAVSDQLAAAEDREFCYRWLQRNFLMTFAPEAKIYHRHRLTLNSFCRLHFRYGRGAYHYHLLRAGGRGAGGLKPDWRFYWTCVRYPFQHMPKSRAAAVVALLLLWQVFNAAGYFWQRSRHGTTRISPTV